MNRYKSKRNSRYDRLSTYLKGCTINQDVSKPPGLVYIAILVLPYIPFMLIILADYDQITIRLRSDYDQAGLFIDIAE